MRFEITKDAEIKLVKFDHLQRFLDSGWQLTQPSPEKKHNTSKAKVKVSAVVVEPNVPADWEHQWEAPLISMPSSDINHLPGNDNANQ